MGVPREKFDPKDCKVEIGHFSINEIERQKNGSWTIRGSYALEITLPDGRVLRCHKPWTSGHVTQFGQKPRRNGHG